MILEFRTSAGKLITTTFTGQRYRISEHYIGLSSKVIQTKAALQKASLNL